MKQKPRGAAGVSLIEVVVAVLLFVSVVIGLGNAVINARRTENSSRKIAEATTLAVDKLERLRSQLLTSPLGETLPGTYTETALGPDGGDGGIYTREWTVTGNVPLLGMRRVRMTVSWNDHGGTAAVTLYTYLSLI